MKVLILSNIPNSLIEFRKELIAKLLDKGCIVTVCAPLDGKYSDKLIELGCCFIDTPVDRRGINPKTDLALYHRYKKLLRELAPDLVITYTIKPNVYGGYACRRAGIPYAANITGLGTAFQREGALKMLVTGMYRVALKGAKTVFFENADNLQTLQQLGICTPEQSRLLNGAGVNLSHYALQPWQPSNTTRFLFVGRVMEEKGIGELFAAMERLHREGANCVLDVVGRYEEDFAQAVAAGERTGWLCYHGYQEDVRPFIAAAHCFVLPSWHEGMANTNLECAASGRPIITSDIPGCREAVIPETSGLLCQPKDADSVYRAMARFLALPQAQREAMGLAGRAHMEAAFDKQKVVEQTIRGLGL